MTIITRLTNERIEELTELRLEKGLESIVSFLYVTELNQYMVNIVEARERRLKMMLKFKEGGSAYNTYKEMLLSLDELQKEVEDRIEELSKSVETVKPVEVKKVKKGKLTPTQEKLLQEIKDANYIYKEMNDRTIDHYNFFADGKLVTYRFTGSALMPKSKVYLISENKFTLEGHSSTLKALEKKGYITIETLGGQGLDYISLVEAVEHIEPYTQLEKVKVECTYFDDYVGKEITTSNDLYCPIGESEQTLKAYNAIQKKLQYEIKYVEVIDVKTWKSK